MTINDFGLSVDTTIEFGNNLTLADKFIEFLKREKIRFEEHRLGGTTDVQLYDTDMAEGKKIVQKFIDEEDVVKFNTIFMANAFKYFAESKKSVFSKIGEFTDAKTLKLDTSITKEFEEKLLNDFFENWGKQVHEDIMLKEFTIIALMLVTNANVWDEQNVEHLKDKIKELWFVDGIDIADEYMDIMTPFHTFTIELTYDEGKEKEKKHFTSARLCLGVSAYDLQGNLIGDYCVNNDNGRLSVKK